MTPTALDELLDEVRDTMRASLDPEFGPLNDALDAADWVVVFVKRLGRVGDCVVRLDMRGQRHELLGLAGDVLACIGQIDLRLAPRSPR